MRIAALYDIHGNLPALDAVLEDVRRASADLVVIGGDVLPGPMPRETLARLLDADLPLQFIQGNGDRAVLEQMTGAESAALPEQAREAIRWNAAELRASDAELLASWPKTLRIERSVAGTVLFCHATPRSDSEIFTRRTPAETLRPLFDGVDAALVVCGHTHMQFDRMVGSTRVVNAGSVGMPFGEPGAYWLLLGPEIELRRTAYDLAAAADRIRATRYPQAREFAERDVLRPRSEREALELFVRAELR